ncbi:putative protein kinase RLK-Pelle-LRR-I-1 family [Helianthus annuus]|nr:putative protein kinase RLK-Pelle-LRR-I-1 family [Helianthus annuus]
MTKLQITLEDVVKATNNFQPGNIIRHDKFSNTYKGELLHSGKEMKISVRRFDCKHGECDLQFLKEKSVLSDLKHTNIVSIIGYCEEKDEKIIVTTLEANGSLRQYLNNLNLTWKQRLRICVGVARALSYLHYEKGRDYAITHSNIKSDTILLDDNWEAKLSGFEISMIDSSFEKTEDVTHKSDIYSFGVVLFETLCRGKAYIEEDNRSLVSLAKYHYKNKTLKDIIHPNLWNQMSLQSRFIYSETTYSCLNEDLDMLHVIAGLEKALEVQLARENTMFLMMGFWIFWENKFEHLKIRLSDIKLATKNFSETHAISIWTKKYTLYKAERHYFYKYEKNSSSKKGKNKGEHSKGDNNVYIKRYTSGNEAYGEGVLVEMLTSVKYPNMVPLLGFCVEASEMIHVFEDDTGVYHNATWDSDEEREWKLRDH